jgi:protease-4
MGKLSNILGSILILLILINIAPSLIQNIKEEYSTLWESKTKVGRLKITSELDDISFYQQQLEKFFKNSAIKAILIEFDCSGGAAGSSQALYNEILHLKAEYKKPVVALTYNMCPSGAYYVACATDYIIASPSALIGSIGSYLEQFKFDKLLEHVSVNYEIEKTGTYKSASNFFTPLTPEQKKMLQEVSDSCYQQFIHDIACRRGLSLSNADTWANGRIFTGTEALKLRLIDELGSEYNARQKIKQLALIERDIEWVRPTYPSLWSQLAGQEGYVRDPSTLNSLCTLTKILASALAGSHLQLKY